MSRGRGFQVYYCHLNLATPVRRKTKWTLQDSTHTKMPTSFNVDGYPPHSSRVWSQPCLCTKKMNKNRDNEKNGQRLGQTALGLLRVHTPGTLVIRVNGSHCVSFRLCWIGRARFMSVLPDAQKEVSLDPQSRTFPVFRKIYQPQEASGRHSLCVSHRIRSNMLSF